MYCPKLHFLVTLGSSMGLHMYIRQHMFESPWVEIMQGGRTYSTSQAIGVGNVYQNMFDSAETREALQSAGGPEKNLLGQKKVIIGSGLDGGTKTADGDVSTSSYQDGWQLDLPFPNTGDDAWAQETGMGAIGGAVGGMAGYSSLSGAVSVAEGVLGSAGAAGAAGAGGVVGVVGAGALADGEQFRDITENAREKVFEIHVVLPKTVLLPFLLRQRVHVLRFASWWLIGDMGMVKSNGGGE